MYFINVAVMGVWLHNQWWIASEVLASPPHFRGSPWTCFVHKFSSFLVKTVLSTHIIYSEADHKHIRCFQKAPSSNCNVQVLCFESGPQQTL